MAWRADYDYDRYGNRMQLSPEQSQNVNLPYIAVTSADINAQTNRFTSGVTYDAAGQITADAKFRGRQYQYDANGRMKWSAYSDGTGVATSVYDGLGQRVETSAGGVTRQHVYDAFGRVVAEYVISGAPQTGSTYKVSYAMYDRQGSKRVVMNESGAVVARHDYYPFGEEIAAGTGQRSTSQGYGATDNVRQRYGGTERDEGSGLEHTPWRKLESMSGRWTSPDPYQGSIKIGDPQSFNRYAYVQNDPMNLTDPSGLLPILECRLLGRIFDTNLFVYTCRLIELGGGNNFIPREPPIFDEDDDEFDLEPDPEKPEQLNQAFADAVDILKNDGKCASFFGARSKRSLNNLLRTVNALYKTARYDENLDTDAATKGKGRSAKISVGPTFFNDNVIRINVTHSPKDPRQYRAHTILHELAHALNRIPDDIQSFDQQIKNNDRITEECGEGLSKLK